MTIPPTATSHPTESDLPPVELHPFEPFLPTGCRLLMLGSFPPSPRRWAMRFYYPNFTNDMWRIFGLCFFTDKNHFVDIGGKTFRLNDITNFLTRCGIGLYDTASAVRRLKNTASDKDLEIVKNTDMAALLRHIPECRAIVVTSQKACDTLCASLNIETQPPMGRGVEFTFENRKLRLYRMPSSSRAYPMKLETKAKSYCDLFEWEGIKP